MALSINKQKEKDWNNLIKQHVKSVGWKFKGWFAYKAAIGFFYEISFYAHGSDNAISGSLAFKPLIIDEVFWDITDLFENKKKPMSLRGNGAFVVDSKEVSNFKLNVVPNMLKEDIKNLLNKIDLEVEELQSNITDISAFVAYLEQHPDTRSEWFDSDLLIVASIIQQNYHKALSLLDYAKKNREMGGWGFGDKSFYDLAIEYCQKQH